MTYPYMWKETNSEITCANIASLSFIAIRRGSCHLSKYHLTFYWALFPW